MTAALTSLLALAVIVQAPSRPLEGTVVDEASKPVAGAAVLFQQSAADQPAKPQTHTDAAGRFRITAPIASLGRVSALWIYKSGLALAALDPGRDLPGTITLKAPNPRTLTIEAPGGKPIGGAKMAPECIVFVRGDLRHGRRVPVAVAQAFEATTGADGKAIFLCLAHADQFSHFTISDSFCGRQCVRVNDDTMRSLSWSTATIRLKPTSRLAGAVKSATGEPISGQRIEVWSRGTPGYEVPRPVEFKNGGVRTAADRSFQTPDNLFVGSSYRAVVRAPGMEPVLTEWITIGAKPPALLPFILRPLSSISGRALDRQGKPVASIEVLQSGDGPERTAVVTDAAGQFTLGGYSRGPAFLFARGRGYRFTGRLVEPGDRNVTLEITRLDDPAARAMRMLADPTPLEESRALARRLIEPFWKSFDTLNGADKVIALRTLASIDPYAALRKLEAVKLPGPQWRDTVRMFAAVGLAATDPAEAETVAEAIDAPGARAVILLEVADALPDSERVRKLALLERAIVQARAAAAPRQRANLSLRAIARLFAIGEKARAQALLPEGLKLSKDLEGQAQPFVVPIVARADPAAAVALATEVATKISNRAGRTYMLLASEIAAQDPAEAERVWGLIPTKEEREHALLKVAPKIAEVDPDRAWRITDSTQQEFDHPQRYLFLAHGLRSRDPAGARRAFYVAMDGFDQRIGDSRSLGPLRMFQIALPFVEQVDPALVPEYFWRILALRPARGDVNEWDHSLAGELAVLLAWYDRDVARALLQPIQGTLERGDDLPLPARIAGYLAWAMIDPPAAVAHLEKMPLDLSLENPRANLRFRVAELLAMPQAARWKDVYSEYAGLAEYLMPQF
jgi:hypothetical protein